MIDIKALQKTDFGYVKGIAELHKRAFPSFFLTQLGVPFLKALYTGYMEDEESGIIVAEDSDKLVGFIAFSNDYPRFYKNLIRKHILRFAFCSLGATIRHPSFFKRLLGAFKKSESVVKEERYVELSSICVDPSSENRGVGSALMVFLKNRVDFSVYRYINLETDANKNDRANRFYQKNGFALSREFYTPEGRRMNEYRYAPGDEL